MNDPRKKFETALRLFSDVPVLHLAFASRRNDTPLPALAIEDRIYVLDFQRDMSKLLRLMDLFRLPSRNITFSPVPMEALASDLAMVTARKVGAAEFIASEAVVVGEHSTDAAALASTLKAVAGSRKWRRTMGGAVRAMTLQDSWQVMPALYSALLAIVAVEARHGA